MTAVWRLVDEWRAPGTILTYHTHRCSSCGALCCALDGHTLPAKCGKCGARG